MRAVIQRVTKAEVFINNQKKAKIDSGLLVFLGIDELDDHKDLDYLISKITGLRIFNDEYGKMNLSIQDITGEILVVSQFTLFASTKKGNRPSFIRSADPSKAKFLYESFISSCTEIMPGKVKNGVFAANMQLDFINDGPVTIIIDSKNKSF